MLKINENTLNKFCLFLDNNNFQKLLTTNPYEHSRWAKDEDLVVIYRKRDYFTIPRVSEDVYNKFLHNSNNLFSGWSLSYIEAVKESVELRIAQGFEGEGARSRFFTELVQQANLQIKDWHDHWKEKHRD